MTKQIFLHDWHIEKKAKMVPFADFLLPLQYSSIIEEHKNAREKVVLFDVSHMGEFFIEGKEALPAMEYLFANNISKLEKGEVLYSPLLYPNGGFVDDVTIYCFSQEKYMICVNAANIEKDAAWIQENLQGDCHFTNASSSYAQMALQGPKSVAIIQEIFNEAVDLKYYSFLETSFQDEACLIARMGYTGEDGFELFISPTKIQALWEKIYQIGQSYSLLPAGLGARDTLRLEASFPLYGNDIDADHTPIEAALKRFVSFEKDFIGKQALEQQLKEGAAYKFIRFVTDGKAIPRHDYQIQSTDSQVIGKVTSGCYSPLLSQGIGMGYIKTKSAKIGDTITIIIREKPRLAHIIKGSFIQYYKNQQG